MRVVIQRDPLLNAVQLAVVREASLAALLRRCGDTLGVAPRAGLTVRCTSDAELRALNHDFASNDHVTDVLAFPGDGRDHVGDIALSLERVIEQARGAGQEPAQEARLLAVHGLLHCLGHDHGNRREAAAMTAATRALLPDQTVPDLVAAD